jgi:serine phosphatase RsbU (regulator of sigma subunit)
MNATPRFSGLASVARHLLGLWPLPALFLLAQAGMRLAGNSGALSLSPWLSALDMAVFLALFGGAAFRVWRPVSGLAGGRSRMDAVMMAHLPQRALRAFALAGAIFGSWLMLVLLLAAEAADAPTLTPRMTLALAFSVYFCSVVLAPALATAITVRGLLRERLARARHGNAGRDEWHPLHSITDSSRRPWLVFLVTGLIPAALLASFTLMIAGTEEEVEEHFIAAQALLTFVLYALASAGIVHLLSRSLRLVTGELARGLGHLREGRFDAVVPVLTDDDLGELARGLNLALAGLREREELKDSLAIASEIQQGLLPRRLPDVPGYAFCAFEQSCEAAGGDYYDFIELDDGRWWLVMADVAGKGYPAALTVANLQAMLRVLAAENVPFDKAVAYVNRALCGTLAGGRFVTMFIAKFQPRSHSLLWLNAGHVPPLWARESGVERLHATSPPLGMVEAVDIEPRRIEIGAGDVILACTDGITEARNQAGEMFGEDRLADWLRARRNAPVAGLADDLMRVLRQFGQLEATDDITLWGVKREA